MDSSNNKKTMTGILCELTRLKSQQKYLECSQVKINPDNYEGDVKQLIHEIDNLKSTLDNQLNDYKEIAKRDVQDMWVFINAIKEDVFNEDNFKKCSVNGIRERIIGINVHLNKLCEKNKTYLDELQSLHKTLEEECKIILK